MHSLDVDLAGLALGSFKVDPPQNGVQDEAQTVTVAEKEKEQAELVGTPVMAKEKEQEKDGEKEQVKEKQEEKEQVKEKDEKQAVTEKDEKQQVKDGEKEQVTEKEQVKENGEEKEQVKEKPEEKEQVKEKEKDKVKEEVQGKEEEKETEKKEEEETQTGTTADPTAGLSFESLKVEDGEKLDTPEVALQAPQLNEDVEALPDTQIKKVLADPNTPYVSASTFEDLSLSPALLQGIYSEMKFEKPSKIQAITLPMIVMPPYQNLIAQAHNGSGKTTCFVLGMLSRVDPTVRAPQALCVCPTRELAIQNQEVLLKMGKYTGISSVLAIPTESSLLSSTRRGQVVDQVVIGTPGTLKRWMTKDKILNTRSIKVLVFDEADHMLDQYGFKDDSERIMKDLSRSTGGNYQILLFSATYSEQVKGFAMKTVQRANFIFVPKENLSLDVIKQYRVRCPTPLDKIEVLRDRIFPVAEKLGQSIIFVRSRGSASELHRRLEADGHKCTSIQGGLSHEDRDRVIREFRSGETKILIATDLLARGFDQAQVTLVVNFDIPVKQNRPYEPDYEVYLHRIGRSGRFGRKGAAFNLVVTEQDERDLDKIARHFNRVIPNVQYDDDDAFEEVLKEAGLA